jgi:hypothetical protein
MSVGRNGIAHVECDWPLPTNRDSKPAHNTTKTTMLRRTVVLFCRVAGKIPSVC